MNYSEIVTPFETQLSKHFTGQEKAPFCRMVSISKELCFPECSLHIILEASSRGGPGSIPDQSMWDMWWALPCQYHFTNVPYASSFTSCFYQKDKRAKPKKFPKSNGLSESREHSIEKYFLSVCKGLNRMYIKTNRFQNNSVQDY